jgi:hypothetical protein
MRLYLDPGHGGSDPGAQGSGLNEKDVTLDIALRLRTILLNYYENIEIRMSRTSDITKSLSERTNEANSWGADFYLSIHINSDSNSAQGYEDYIYSGLSDTSATAKYQNVIHTEVKKVNQLKDRGQKKENFHVLRESSMPALLTENGFIDNAHDAALMKQSSWRQNVAQGHANGLARAFNLKRKSTFQDIPGQPNHPINPLPGTIFKVIAGSFQSKENAEERVTYLRSKGFQAFVNTITISGQIWYRAQAGAYTIRENAEQQLDELKKAGINDAFLVAESASTSSQTVTSSRGSASEDTKSRANGNTDIPTKSGNNRDTTHGHGTVSGSGTNSGTGNGTNVDPGSTETSTGASSVSGSGSNSETGNNNGNNTDPESTETSPASGSVSGSGTNPRTGKNSGDSVNSGPTGTSPSSNGTTGSTTDNSSEEALIPAHPSVDTILGPTYLSPEHMNQYVKSINPNAPELGSYYLTFGNQYGIRGDVAFAQALFETNFFRFTGVVQPDQNNFAGLGSTGPNTRGAYFKTPEDGVLAQLQHLFAYATTKPLPGPYSLVDPRFHLVDRGSAPTWTALNGKWAYPGDNYGQSILNLYQRMIDFTLQHLESICKGSTANAAIF